MYWLHTTPVCFFFLTQFTLEIKNKGVHQLGTIAAEAEQCFLKPDLLWVRACFVAPTTQPQKRDTTTSLTLKEMIYSHDNFFLCCLQRQVVSPGSCTVICLRLINNLLKHRSFSLRKRKKNKFQKNEVGVLKIDVCAPSRHFPGSYVFREAPSKTRHLHLLLLSRGNYCKWLKGIISRVVRLEQEAWKHVLLQVMHNEKGFWLSWQHKKAFCLHAEQTAET